MLIYITVYESCLWEQAVQCVVRVASRGKPCNEWLSSLQCLPASGSCPPPTEAHSWPACWCSTSASASLPATLALASTRASRERTGRQTSSWHRCSVLGTCCYKALSINYCIAHYYSQKFKSITVWTLIEIWSKNCSRFCYVNWRVLCSTVSCLACFSCWTWSWLTRVAVLPSPSAHS